MLAKAHQDENYRKVHLVIKPRRKVLPVEFLKSGPFSER